MGCMNDQVRFIREGIVNVIRITFPGMKSNHPACFLCCCNEPVNILDIAGAADPKTIGDLFPAIPAEDQRMERKTICCLCKGLYSRFSTLPEISTAMRPPGYHAPDACPHTGNKFAGRGLCQQAVFQPVRGSNKRGKVAGCAAVHGNRIAKVRVGIKKCRADPAIRGTRIFLDCGDDAIFNRDVGRHNIELFAKEYLAGQDPGSVFHGG